MESSKTFVPLDDVQCVAPVAAGETVPLAGVDIHRRRGAAVLVVVQGAGCFLPGAAPAQDAGVVVLEDLLDVGPPVVAGHSSTVVPHTLHSLVST